MASYHPRPAPEPPPNSNITAIINHIAMEQTYMPTHNLSMLDTIHTYPDNATDNNDNTNNIPVLPDDTGIQCEATQNQPHHLDIPRTSSRGNLKTITLLCTAAITAIHMAKMQLHVDGGANRSITNARNHLLSFRNIHPYYMSSANGTNDIKCSGMGYLPWRAPSGDIILIKCNYSAQVNDTIVSPSDIVMNYLTKFHTWMHHADLMTNKGYIKVSNADTNHSIIYPLVCINSLWYSFNDDHTDLQPSHKSEYKLLILLVSSAGT
jgi:hypothetical protein